MEEYQNSREDVVDAILVTVPDDELSEENDRACRSTPGSSVPMTFFLGLLIVLIPVARAKNGRRLEV